MPEDDLLNYYVFDDAFLLDLEHIQKMIMMMVPMTYSDP